MCSSSPMTSGSAAAAAAAAKSLQLCPTLCDPVDGSPPGSSVPESLQARTLEWVAISFSNAWKWKVKVKSLSRVRLLATPWIAAHQALRPWDFSRQEYWTGVPLPSPTSGSRKAHFEVDYTKSPTHKPSSFKLSRMRMCPSVPAVVLLYFSR